MADTFQLELATPERLLVNEQVTEAEIPAKNGYLGVLAGHAPLLTALGAGVLKYRAAGRQGTIAVAGGFVEVFDNYVRVLADRAELPQNIDSNKARQDLDRANDALKKADSEAASDSALLAAESAQARLDAASGESTPPQ